MRMHHFACLSLVAFALIMNIEIVNAQAANGQKGAFYKAVSSRDLKQLKRLLIQDASSNFLTQGDKDEALYRVARRENAGGVILLLAEFGANLEMTPDSSHWTPLFEAINAPSPANVAALLKAGAKTDTRDYEGNTPLLMAVLPWHHGSSGDSPALIQSVRPLLEYGSDVNVRNNQGLTPLQVALEDGRLDIAALLKKEGAKTKDELSYYLLAYARNGNVRQVRSLITKGAKIGVTSRHGMTPLVAAAANGKEAVVRLLLNCGAGQIQKTHPKRRHCSTRQATTI